MNLRYEIIFEDRKEFLEQKPSVSIGKIYDYFNDMGRRPLVVIEFFLCTKAQASEDGSLIYLTPDKISRAKEDTLLSWKINNIDCLGLVIDRDELKLTLIQPNPDEPFLLPGKGTIMYIRSIEKEDIRL